MAQQKWRFSELPENETDLLKTLYGAQPKDDSGFSVNKILYVRELTEYEKNLFAGRSFLSSNFLTQALYKLKGVLVPLRFNRVLRDMVIRSEILRTNYYQGMNGSMAVVFQERAMLPQVDYRNMEELAVDEIDSTLRKLMEADMREGIDLRRGHLIRFSVYHTAQDEYAVLVTMAQIIMDRVDIKSILRELMGLEPEVQQETSGYSGTLSSGTNAAILEYWTKMLRDLPPPSVVPYTRNTKGQLSRQQVYRKRIPPDIMSDIRELAKSNKMMLMAILQMAWGFLLQESNACKDVLFCLVVPDRRAAEGKSSGLGGSFRMIPVRCKSSDDLSVKKLVGQQFQQLVVSQPYSGIDLETLQKITGNRKSLFDYFLSFYDFMMEEQAYSDVKALPEGALVLRNSWDAGGSRLGVYFRYEEQGISFSLMYDERRFAPMGGRLLAQRYLRVLQQVITDWNLSYPEFMQNLKRRISMDSEGESAYRKQDEFAQLQDALSRVRLFQESGHGLIQNFRNMAKLETRFEGDRISGDDIDNNFVFISRGRVARNIDMGNGWYNALDILKDGAWVNETVLSFKRESNISAEVLTEEAEILMIPVPAMRDFLKGAPDFRECILQHILRQMEKYQRLWMQA